MEEKRNVSVGGNVVGSAIVTGDSNTVTVQFEKAQLPCPASVNISAELARLSEILSNLQIPAKEGQKIKNALEEAELEVKEAAPDRNEVGAALDRALTYAQKAEGFADSLTKLKPHVANITGWLGDNWHKLLAVVGLTT